MRGRRLVRAPKNQAGFGFVSAVHGQAPVPTRRKPPAPAIFRDPDPTEIWAYNTRLDDLLESRKLVLPLELRAFIRTDLDLTPLTSSYRGGGNQPIHPAIIIGLVIYGMLHGTDTTRGLEELSQADVGAWWICGGLSPDHTTISKLLTRHAAYLSDAFFVEATSKLLKRLGAKPGTVAVDGTVIEAAASRFGMLKKEAAKVAAQEAAAAADANPGDETLQAAAVRALEVHKAVESRAERAASNHSDPSKVVVAPSDPDAVVQPLKNLGVSRPGYKPSLIVDNSKLIVGQHLHASSENASLKPMLAQHEAILGGAPLIALADSGYFNGEALKTMTDADVDILVPPAAGKPANQAFERDVDAAAPNSPQPDATKQGKTPKPPPLFPKSAFRFDELEGAYYCPAGRKLVATGTGQQGTCLKYTRYTGLGCRDCPLRGRCTTSAARTIKRYEGDDLKEHMARIFENPLARDRFSARRTIVEPVFGDFREQQGFRRFRRRGEARVAMEFSLHCVAYNFGRARSLLKARRAVAVFVFARLPGGPWRLAAVWLAFL